jgi:hypothetical protein
MNINCPDKILISPNTLYNISYAKVIDNNKNKEIHFLHKVNLPYTTDKQFIFKLRLSESHRSIESHKGLIQQRRNLEAFNFFNSENFKYKVTCLPIDNVGSGDHR